MNTESSESKYNTKIVTASFTIPAIVTVTALVVETRIYSVKTCNTKKDKTTQQINYIFNV